LRIILVDSSEVFRLGVKALFADTRDLDARVVAEAADSATALAAVRAHAPDLLVTDLELADASGLELATAARELSPATRVLVLAAAADDASLRQSAVAGVDGYVLKSQAPPEIVAAVRDAAAGRHVEPPPAREAPGAEVADVPRNGRAAVLDRLSAREREIFDLIIWGQTNKQVAVKLGISVKTVETHRSHINGKLQVHSAAELVRLASLCGVLAADGGADASSTRAAHAKMAMERSALPRLLAKIG
jgi:DNA-binding NarL/FixJ family response regulator